MKSVGIQYIEALRRLKLNKGKSQFNRTIHLVYGPEEEIGAFDGMRLFSKSKEFDDLNIGFALDEGIAVPEDTYPVYYAERSVWWVKFNCIGCPGHGSKFIDESAPEKLSSIIASAYAYRDAQKRLLDSNPKLSLGDVTTVNMSIVQGGVQVNVLPAEMSASFDMRLTPTESFEEFEEMLKQWCKKAGNNVTYQFLQENYNKEMTSISMDDKWWKTFNETMHSLGCKIRPEIFPAATDARFVRARGIPALGFSPMIHTPTLLHDHNEYLNESVFLRGIEIYETLIENLANVP